MGPGSAHRNSVARRRHAEGIGAAGVYSRDTHSAGGFNPIPTDPFYGSYSDLEMIQSPDLPADIIGPGHIGPGVITGGEIDTTPPGIVTFFELDSLVVTDSDGHAILQMIATVTQPIDPDVYGVWVEYTNSYILDVDGNITGPDWNYSGTLFIPKGRTTGVVTGVAGGTIYFGRAWAVDVVGNASAPTADVQCLTGEDFDAPPIPQTLAVSGGYRGFGASFDTAAVADLMFNEIRYAPDDGTGVAGSPENGGTPGAPDTGNWVTSRSKSNAVFVAGLVGEDWYWVQVRCVDLSGNVQTSSSDPTAVDYLLEPEAGWCEATAVWTLLIGSEDIAYSSITADHIAAGSLDANDIGTGTITVSPMDGDADGIVVIDGTAPPDGVIIGRWDEHGIKIIDPTDANKYVLLDGGEIKFTSDGGATFPSALTPEGLNATAITFGQAPGGHNLVMNSSFELSAFAAAGSTFDFTTNATWKAENRVTAPENILEGGANLSIPVATLPF